MRISLLLLAFLPLFISACSNDDNEAVSTDIEELGNYINLSRYPPKSVKWWEVPHEKKSSRTVEPTDYRIEAELHYDKATVLKIMDDYQLLSVSYQSYRKELFDFEWLDPNLSRKLSKSNIFNYNPYFFGGDQYKQGGFVIIDDTTILLYLTDL